MTPEAMKSALWPFAKTMRNASQDRVLPVMAQVFHEDANIQMCHPFGDLVGGQAWWAQCLEPLVAALPDLERRDMIVVGGTTEQGEHWLGCMGNYMGTFCAPFMDIQPTGHLVHMRYHEFFGFRDGRVATVQAIWDMPELMMQAKAWPMAPQLGVGLCTPAPMTCDGLDIQGDGQGAMRHVLAMLDALCQYPANPDPQVMQLERYWHPRFNWYGPAGIGTARGVAGFRHWHQIPFLRGMPDRKLDAAADLMSHWVAQGQYVAETGWPNMRLTLSGDGWMGIAPSAKEVVLRSLDFWRLEDGLIRENWVLVDLLDLYQQLGVDVFARLAEFNKAKALGPEALFAQIGP